MTPEPAAPKVEVKNAPVDSNSSEEIIEPIVKWLFAAIFGLVIVLVLVDKWLPNDGQIFQVLAGLVSAFSGGLMMRIKPKGTQGASSGVQTSVTQVNE